MKKIKLNTDQLSSELSLILQILNNEKVLLGIEPAKNIDWDLFVELSLHHRVYSLLYPKLKGIDGVPLNILNTFAFFYKQNSFNMLHLSGQMKKISQFFLDESVDVLFLKGPVLSIDLYGDLSLRTSSDIDVLIPIDDLQRVDQLLTQIGFVKDEYITSILDDWKWRHHHVNYENRASGVKLEVHWRLNPGPAKEPPFADLWNRKRKSALTEFPIYYLGREDLFMFLLTHGARHGWSRLRWMIDIDRLIKQNVDWDFLMRLLRRYQYSHICGKVIILANRLLQTPIPNQSKQLISKRAFKLAELTMFYITRMVNLHSPPLPKAVEKYHARYLFSIKSLSHKVYYLVSCMLPFPKDKEVIMLPSSMHFLYIPLRPIIWAMRKSKKIA
ncbi:nucleotidyltransferase domain-containing protein [Metabacillus idriensis]|uniref:nucleotidyltransferase domain-containing protein n=1 Tax=Metabacillus idriensis TaxID=324768 RepID=UPI001749D8CD|nr:nucleotidyltransferase family protein [Metabacillus idriensis]